jgi:hypothetical protein
MEFTSKALRAGLALAALACGSAAQSQDKLEPSQLVKPSVCPTHYEFKNDACTAKPEEVTKPTKETCEAAGFILTGSGTAAKCEPGAGAPPNPECKALPGFVGKVSGTGAKATCSYARTVSVSAKGDYIGDCFKIKGRPAGTNLIPGNTYFVSGQRDIDKEDRDLTLVPGEVWLLPRLTQFVPTFGCQATAGEQERVAASKLIEAGASRMGYAYGFLTMPYKYFPSEKSFVANVPIGGYLGWRYGQAGSGTTAAVAVTLSTVKADTVDPATLDAQGKPKVIGSANVAALSGAFGFMFDVLKSPQGKPFKAGVFVGVDVVNKDPTIDYRYNRKKWVAIQLGYDFTDN